MREERTPLHDIALALSGLKGAARPSSRLDNSLGILAAGRYNDNRSIESSMEITTMLRRRADGERGEDVGVGQADCDSRTRASQFWGIALAGGTSPDWENWSSHRESPDHVNPEISKSFFREK